MFNFIKKIRLSFDDNNIKKIILLFIVTRLLLAVVGFYAHNVLPTPYRMYDVYDEKDHFGRIGTVLHGWDSMWYLQIADEGYPKVNISDLYHTETAMAFYPFYPLTIKLFGLLFGNITSAVFVSNFCLLMSGILLYKIVKIRYGKDIGYKSAKYLLIFPTTFILSAIQTESLFLFLLLRVFLFLEQKKFVWSGIVGFLLALTRPIGFLAFLPIGVEVYKTLSTKKSLPFIDKLTRVTSALLPVAGILSYILYLHYLTGSFEAVIASEKTWGKEFSLDAVKLYNLIGGNFNGFHYVTDIMLGFTTIFFAFFGLIGLGFGYTLITVSILGVYLTTTSLEWHILSFPRFFSVLFPAYIGAGKMAKDSKLFDFSASVIFVVLQCYMFFFWTRGFPTPM